MEYLESTGTQLIDTKILPSENLTTTISIKPIDRLTNYGILGSSWSTEGYFLQFDASEYLKWHTGGKVFFSGNYSKGTYNIISVSPSKFVVNDVVIADISPGSNSSNSIKLFGVRNNGDGSAFQLSTAIMKDGENTLRNFIPCYRKSDNEAGMYDMVSKQFFENKGTGDFLVGPDVPEPPKPPEPDTPTTVTLQVGANSGEDNQIDVTTGFSLDGFSADVSTQEKASESLDKIDALKDKIVTKRSDLGTARNRLESVLSSESIREQNLSASLSTIRDTDYANETANMTKNQILQNMTSALLAQANSVPSIALQLLK